MTKDHRMIIYEQDCKSWRHQDTQQWGRFQTAATIEAGMLYGLYQTTISIGEKFGLALFGSCLVLIVSGLAFKQNLLAKGHLNRVAKFEKPVAPWEPARSWWAPSGKWLLRCAILVITVMNAMVCIKFASQANLAWLPYSK
jgi:hypothetical protein